MCNFMKNFTHKMSRDEIEQFNRELIHEFKLQLRAYYPTEISKKNTRYMHCISYYTKIIPHRFKLPEFFAQRPINVAWIDLLNNCKYSREFSPSDLRQLIKEVMEEDGEFEVNYFVREHIRPSELTCDHISVSFYLVA